MTEIMLMAMMKLVCDVDNEISDVDLVVVMSIDSGGSIAIMVVVVVVVWWR